MTLHVLNAGLHVALSGWRTDWPYGAFQCRGRGARTAKDSSRRVRVAGACPHPFLVYVHRDELMSRQDTPVCPHGAHA